MDFCPASVAEGGTHRMTHSLGRAVPSRPDRRARTAPRVSGVRQSVDWQRDLL